MRSINIRIAVTLAGVLTWLGSSTVHSFSMYRQVSTRTSQWSSSSSRLQLSSPSDEESTITSTATTTATDMEDPMTAAMSEQEEKFRRAQELRAQEVFIQKTTGKHECRNCGFIYDETKGEQGVIGGTIPPNTSFEDLPLNWRCPTCRASKDSFKALSEVIPGFAVNQGYGFGGNSLTSSQKTNLIFGGLFLFFLLFLGGYGLS